MKKERVVSRLRRAALLAAAAALAGGLFLSCSDGGGGDVEELQARQPQQVQSLLATCKDTEGKGHTPYRIKFYDDKTWSLWLVSTDDDGEIDGEMECLRGTYTGNPLAAGTVTLTLKSFVNEDEIPDDADESLLSNGSLPSKYWTDDTQSVAVTQQQVVLTNSGGNVVLNSDATDVKGYYEDNVWKLYYWMLSVITGEEFSEEEE